MPTVLAFIPLSNAYTIGGKTVGIFCTPSESPYIATAPGMLQRRNTKMAGRSPAWISAMQKIIFVLAGPGRAWETAKSS